jgi:hypothetical protein
MECWASILIFTFGTTRTVESSALRTGQTAVYLQRNRMVLISVAVIGIIFTSCSIEVRVVISYLRKDRQIKVCPITGHGNPYGVSRAITLHFL